MKRFIIEREIPAIGAMQHQELSLAAAKSCDALAKLAPKVQWIHSYVTTDKTFCIYLADDEDDVRAHAELSGFPANKITEVTTMIDPTTAAS